MAQATTSRTGVRHLVVSAALVFGGAPAHAQPACDKLPAPTAGTAVVARVCAALDAVNAAHPDALRTLMAEDFALTSVSGKYYGGAREEMVARWTAPAPAGTTSRSVLLRVDRAYESATFGLVAGTIEDRTTVKGQSRCDTHAFTDIWELRHGRRVWVQSHESGSRPATCSS